MNHTVYQKSNKTLSKKVYSRTKNGLILGNSLLEQTGVKKGNFVES